MDAVILSAGQGSRLLPLTEDRPKCLLEIGGVSILARQLETLRAAGVACATVVTGFRAAAVEDIARAAARSGFQVQALYNPFYNVADNLASCWMARAAMTGDFLLLNGDTLFEPAILRRLLAAPDAPAVVAIDRKSAYDSDDMKVRLADGRLADIAKTLDADEVDGEAIGLTRFGPDGAAAFVQTLEQTMRTPNGLNWHFPRALAVLAGRGMADVCSIEGLVWAEVDFPHDLEAARRRFGG